MSGLKQFTDKIENESSGEIIAVLPSDKTFFETKGYIKLDGSIALQNTYPSIYQKIGLIPDNLSSLPNIINSGTSNNINTLIYANNTFVYAGNGGVLSTSDDAITWTQRTSETSNNINALTYGNNTFVYVGDKSTLATSNDATTWTQNSLILSLIYVGGRTFARTGNTSPTNISLTSLTGGVSSAPAEGDVVFIAVSTATTTSFSQAVSGYTEITSLYSNDNYDTNLWVGYKVMGSTPDTDVTIPRCLNIANGQTVAIQVWRNTIPGVIFDVTATTSIINNSVIPNPPAITTISDDSILLVVGAAAHSRDRSDTFGASYLNNFLTIGVNDAYDSTIGFGSILVPNAGTYDPAAWTFSGADSTNYSNASVTIALKNRKIKALIYANNTFVYAGNGGVLATSNDAITWTSRTSGTSNNINTLIYANNTFVYAGNGGVLATSNDAITWTSRTSGTSNNINALTYGDGTFVYAGNGGVLSTSSDGITWTSRTSGTSNNINALTYVNGIFLYAGNGGVLSTSSDGITWTSRTSGTSNNINALTYGDGTFVYAGNNGISALYKPYSYNINTHFAFPSHNSYFDLYIKT